MDSSSGPVVNPEKKAPEIHLVLSCQIFSYHTGSLEINQGIEGLSEYGFGYVKSVDALN